MTRTMAAWLLSAAGDLAAREQAIGELTELFEQADEAGFVLASLRSRLVLGKIELASDREEEGRKRLLALEEDARRQGYELLASQAAILGGRR